MKTARLLERMERMPMLKALVPFAAGILFSAYLSTPLWFLLAGFAVAGVAAVLLQSSVYTLCTLFFAGTAAAQLHQTTYTVPTDYPAAFEITVTDIPADRGRYATAEAVVTAWRDPQTGGWFEADDKIFVRADSVTALQAGEMIRCRGTIRPIRGGAESYRKLMEHRGFAGTLWLAERNLLDRTPGYTSTLHTAACARLSRLPMSQSAGAVCRAMTAGDTSGLTSELRVSYSRSGMSHLLSVSGLHVGIVFVLVNFALWWLPLLRRGHLIRNIVAALCIWLFTAAAGFAPSAVRAAVMFSMLQFALASASTYLAGNILAAAAFGMLLWNPAYLFDISFQLSFVAVAAILAWGIPLCRWTHTRWRGVNLITDGIAISLVSTLATAPLVSHTFGIIPVAGIVASPAAIALSTVVVLGGTLWMLAPAGFLAPAFGVIVGRTANLLNALAARVAEMPGAAIEYTLTQGQTALIYLFFVVATAMAWSGEAKKSVHLPR